MPSAAPGRSCPVSYAYGAGALRRAPELVTETLWVAGGLYGNPFALEALLHLYDAEPGEKALVFNGDFHWFDVHEAAFRQIQSAVGKFSATRGNVETELAAPHEGAGCGCGYPDWVDDGTVDRSNAILAALRDTARRFPDALAKLAALPMHLAASVAGERVAVVHGDADSLAGWGFSQEALDTPAGRASADAAFRAAGARIFASSHTCLPVLQGFDGERFIANNGAAGMPNFTGQRFGIATRIAPRPSTDPIYSVRAGGVFVEAIALRYDAPAWRDRFLEQWPPGSAGHQSYFGRIERGPQYGVAQALRIEACVDA